VTYGKTREEAILLMKQSLDRYVIRGPRNNVNFLRDVLENDRFNKGTITTKFIPEEYPNGFSGHKYTEAELEDLLAVVAVMHYRKTDRKWDVDGKLPNAAQPDLTRNFLSLPGGRTVETELLEVDEEVAAVRLGGENGKVVEFGYTWELHEPVFEARFDNEQRAVAVQPLGPVPNGYRLQHVGSEIEVRVWDELSNQLRQHMLVKVARDLSKVLMSPMPGTVVSVDVKVGDKVFDGQALLVLEAMKMQNVLRAPKDAVIKSITVKKGQEVAVDQLLIEFEAAAK
jgi:propionyl-CoA carboxylase alpha chain